MDSISTVTGKLLFFIHSLQKDCVITRKQKGTLKDLLFDNPKNLMLAYQNYLNDGTELTLRSDLLRILQKEKQTDSCDGGSNHSKRSRGLVMNIKIPKRNIQKLPSQMQRL